MNGTDDYDPLEARLARFLPAELPADFQRRLLAAEPPLSVRPRWRHLSAFLPGRLGMWPLAYAGLAGVWMLILALRFATPSAPAVAAYLPAAPVPVGSPSPLVAVGGSSLDHSALLAVNRLPITTSLQP